MSSSILVENNTQTFTFIFDPYCKTTFLWLSTCKWDSLSFSVSHICVYMHVIYTCVHLSLSWLAQRRNKGAASGFPLKSQIIWIHQCPTVGSWSNLFSLIENQIRLYWIVQNWVWVKSNSKVNTSEWRKWSLFFLFLVVLYFLKVTTWMVLTSYSEPILHCAVKYSG